jgi:hypothetical protein
MRLLNTETLTLENFVDVDKPPYAILSHTWGNDEVLFDDIRNTRSSSDQWTTKLGATKIINAAERACKNGFKYIWIDTCCMAFATAART